MPTGTGPDLTTEDLAWARSVARSVYRRLAPLFDFEDLEQVARIAVWRAKSEYDPSRNDNFRLYALPWVRGAVLMLVRSAYREQHHIPLNTQIGCSVEFSPEDVHTTGLDHDTPVYPTAEDDLEVERRAAALKWALKRLHGDQRRMARLLLRGCSTLAAGRLLGLTFAQSYELRDAVFVELRRQLSRTAAFGGVQ